MYYVNSWSRSLSPTSIPHAEWLKRFGYGSATFLHNIGLSFMRQKFFFSFILGILFLDEFEINFRIHPILLAKN